MSTLCEPCTGHGLTGISVFNCNGLGIDDYITEACNYLQTNVSIINYNLYFNINYN